MMEEQCLPCSPILVEDLRPIFCGQNRHLIDPRQNVRTLRLQTLWDRGHDLNWQNGLSLGQNCQIAIWGPSAALAFSQAEIGRPRSEMTRQIDELAAFVADTRWEDVPASVQHHTNLALLDTLGVILAGAERPAVRRLRGQLGTGSGATVYARGLPSHDPRTSHC
jgi:hypothetical protein